MISQTESPDIAFCVYCLDGGGAERAVLNLARSFAEKHYKVELVLFSATGHYLEQISSDIKLVNLQSQNSFDALLKLVRYFRQKQPKCFMSVMHFTNELCILAKCLSRASSTLVVIEQNTLSRELTDKNLFKRLALPIAVNLLYPRADRVVAVSQGAALDLAKTGKLRPDSIDVIYNPVIREDLFEKAKQPVTHPWFSSDGPPIILAIGRFVPQKDFPTLIRAFARVRSVRDTRLVILGSRPDHHPIDDLIQELGLQDFVMTPGFTNNPYAYLARSSVFVLSSLWEGLPTVMIEALALGVPVVSTNCEHGPAEILDNGKYGTIVPVEDSKALAEGILNTLNSTSIDATDEQWLSQFKLEASVSRYQKYLKPELQELANTEA